jgi:hypothetical protein
VGFKFAHPGFKGFSRLLVPARSIQTILALEQQNASLGVDRMCKFAQIETVNKGNENDKDPNTARGKPQAYRKVQSIP